MPFKDQIAQDNVTVFLNPDEFAEPVTYKPKTGSSKQIVAVIKRGQAEPVAQTRVQQIRKKADVYIADDETFGVTAVNAGLDKISFSEFSGQPVVDWVVEEIIGNHHGLWHLRVGK